MSQFFSTENLKSFIQQNPDSLAFAHLGARLIDEGEYQGAIEICQKGLEKHPDYSFGHFILGTAHYHVKNY
jgi:lipoprotein NlpI